MKVEFFCSNKRVQQFLDDHPNIDIKFIKQSSASDGYGDDRMEIETLISIWYTE